MKRKLILWLVLVLLCRSVLSESNTDFYFQIGDMGYGVSAIVSLLKDKGYLDTKHAVDRYDDEITASVAAFQIDSNLTCTGILDDDTLLLLLGEDYADNVPEEYANLESIWVPVSGGGCLHTSMNCSSMNTPRRIPVEMAVYLIENGYTSWCGTCSRELNCVELRGQY